MIKEKNNHRGTFFKYFCSHLDDKMGFLETQLASIDDGLFDLVLVIAVFWGLTLIITLFRVSISCDMLHQMF